MDVDQAGRASADPVAGRDRIAILDALRGFALFGILLANIMDWSGWGSPALDDAMKSGLAGPGWRFVADFLQRMLIEGKFYTIFSFLFGIGFALQLSRLERRRADGAAIYRRRLLVLLAIGIAHILFVWEGDILTLYALLGLTLPFFRSWPERRLLAAAALLILLPIPGYALVASAGIPPHLGLYLLGQGVFEALGGVGGDEAAISWRQRGDLGSHFAWTLSGWPFRIGGLFESWRVPKVLAVMLLGLWAGRRLVAGKLLGDRRLLIRVAAIGFAIGIPANLAFAAIGGLGQETFEDGLLATVLYTVGIAPLGLAYAASFVLLWRRAERALGIFSAPGRMALTNYLLHSVLGITIFYGIGFGLIGRVPPPTIYAIALAIFLFQILFSRLWLKAFEQGPMEWLWRLGTYGGKGKRARASPAGAK